MGARREGGGGAGKGRRGGREGGKERRGSRRQEEYKIRNEGRGTSDCGYGTNVGYERKKKQVVWCTHSPLYHLAMQVLFENGVGSRGDHIIPDPWEKHSLVRCPLPRLREAHKDGCYVALPCVCLY
jgi:hypothetical protein